MNPCSSGFALGQPTAPPHVGEPLLQAQFQAQYNASRAHIEIPLALRKDRLLRMQSLINTHSAALAQAVQADFGVRSPQLTEIADMFVLRGLLSHSLKSLAGWMKPRRVRTPLYLKPSRAFLQRQPLGVVGVVSPWNYPVQLALGPVITALAAGNRVMLKPSELTPATSQLLATLVGKSFASDELCVMLGDAALSAAFCTLPFDHLFFTGSTEVGRKVAQSAALNLTPTTLELGGKSPCVVDVSCTGAALDNAVLKIAHGKLLNAGQTCIAPDYVLLPRGMEAAFTAAFDKAVAQLFPTVLGNPDYAAIISPRHLARLEQMLVQAQADGARLHRCSASSPAVGTEKSRQMPPVLVFDAPFSAALLREEVFGPILPVVPYDHIPGAMTHINAGPRPLALYWFGTDKAARDQLLAGTVSGGVTVNDTLMHIAHENLPFGGVGASGWGSYHGETGFLRLTHEKAVLVQSRFARGDLLYPPYGPRFDRVMGLIKRFVF